MKNR
jgi:hypothetical protein